jgi:hypothetical protein
MEGEDLGQGVEMALELEASRLADPASSTDTIRLRRVAAVRSRPTSSSSVLRPEWPGVAGALPFGRSPATPTAHQAVTGRLFPGVISRPP